MVKRISDTAIEDGTQAYLKRQKISHVVSSAEDVQTSQQLKQLLSFDQDSGRSKHGLQSFKAFLENFADHQTAHRLTIFKEYLETEIPRNEEDKTAVFLEDLMKTWSFASQSNNESLLSAVPAALALLLKILSSNLDFADYALQLGRTLLQKRQLELIARGLTANKTKEFIISPVLRLLQQIITVDGGSLAKQVFRARDHTFKGLVRNLGHRFTGEGVEDRTKPSVRTNALRFCLTLVRVLSTEEKNELLTQRDLTTALTRDIREDPPFLLIELLETLKSHVLQDEKLARESRSRFLNATNLGRLVTLYGYDQSESDLLESKKAIDELAHDILILACTTPNLGILRQQAGFYPQGIDPDYSNDAGGPSSLIDVGLEGLDWSNRFTESVPVRNTVLSEFIQSLRPWSNMKQSKLLIEIFKAAPELVAHYFFNKKTFTFEPKLTATWIGYSSVLFSTIQLPIPPYFGRQGNDYGRVPPPTLIIIESILPQPLTQKALTRCLFNQKSPLVTFFAIRILVKAFQKVQGIISLYREVSSLIWNQAADQVIEEFCRRCPPMKDAINAFKAIPESDIMQRQAASKLLVLYYEVIPQIALESKFDVSGSLTDALRKSDETMSLQDAAMRRMEVENLFQIAHHSPGMRWFNKVDSLPYSPFIAMLRLCVDTPSSTSLQNMWPILRSLIDESGIMQSKTKTSGLDALVFALRAHKKENEIAVIYDFLDNCALRCFTGSVKYIDSIDQYYRAAYPDLSGELTILSVLLLVMVEQWPFIVKSSSSDKIKYVATFIAHYLAASIKVGEDKKIIKLLAKSFFSEAPEGSQEIIERYKKLVEIIQLPDTVNVTRNTRIANHPGAVEHTSVHAISPILDFSLEDFEDHSALVRWTRKEIEEVVEDGHATSLIHLLSSPHLAARKEALININKLAVKLKASSYRGRDQIWIVLMELCETARTHIDTAPLPNTITAFAMNSLLVLKNAGHSLYGKLNIFLDAGPAWEVDKIPLLNSILYERPYEDGARWDEISWLLSYLDDALRTPADMVIFHKRGVYEKILSLYTHAHVSKSNREKILRVLGRATTIEGGSTTLVTRTSAVSWLHMRIAVEDTGGTRVVGGAVLRSLLARILDTCDKERVETWSGRPIEQMLLHFIPVDG